MSGVHEKYPFGPTTTLDAEDPSNESLRLNVGLVNPTAEITNENGVPGAMFPTGATDWIVADGGGVTVIAIEVVAESPEKSDATMVNECHPASRASGTTKTSLPH